jgi:hypothetical protein
MSSILTKRMPVTGFGVVSAASVLYDWKNHVYLRSQSVAARALRLGALIHSSSPRQIDCGLNRVAAFGVAFFELKRQRSIVVVAFRQHGDRIHLPFVGVGAEALRDYTS